MRFDHVSVPQKACYGAGRGRDIAAELHLLGVARPFLVCSPRLARSREVAALREACAAGAVTVFDRGGAHAPLEAAIAGGEAARAAGADGIVALGGGSVSDLAKGIALALAEGGEIEAFVLRREDGAITGRTSSAPKVPLIAVPTTLSGAEVTPGFSLTRADAYKLIFRDPALAARVVVLDPDLLAGAPASLLAGSGMNALAHCCEALYSRARTPVSDPLAREGLARLWRGLNRRLDGGDGAEDMLIGAYLAALAIVNARTALHHAICHKLGPLAGIGHGEANAAMLGHVMRFNLPACPAETGQIAQALGCGAGATAEAVAAQIESLPRRAGLCTRLRDYGLAADRLPLLAERVHAEPGLAFNPRPIPGVAELLGLLRAAW